MPAEPMTEKRGPMPPALWGALFLLLVWSGGALTLRSLDQGKPADWDRAALLYLPSGKWLKPMAMDLDEGLAAAFWVRGMVYFADAYLAGRGYEWLGRILEVVSELNPRFLAVYEFGGALLLKEKGGWPSAKGLLEKGVAQFPDNWRLRVFLAVGLAASDSDFVGAAEALKPVSLIQGVPDHVRTLAATFLEKGGSERLALAFLIDRYLNAPDALSREVFLDRMLKNSTAAGGDEAKKPVLRSLLDLMVRDPRSLELATTVITEYLGGAMSPGSRRIVESVRR